MKFIDYSEKYFRKRKKTAVPPKRSGKFIQIINEADGEEYIVLSPREFSVYHANIAELFCRDHHISGEYNAKKDYFQLLNNSWEIRGGGSWMIDEDKKTLELSGASQAYGAFEAAALKVRLLSARALADYTIFINGA